ncbi:hypothetical protein TrLO_g2969 [Triparma laevis f. longispina]|uniref:Alpha-ketoglutarate-dependent dioxygenase AlkB-like domain-containing protein n=1 Tax=Triparma laevis f. longispina TaxID=1714387 RepID=A0A9W7A401_9STRA|nr:hypothetical protein TrLO_g2969 [Triparma laevis f. longispina]
MFKETQRRWKGDYPGFIYCPSALSPSLISTLSHLCLSSYCEPPHETNITLLPLKPNEIISDDNTSMFQKYVKGLDVSQEYRNFGKLSWATCGYNYDWSLRKYHEDRKSPFPRGLSTLSSTFAALTNEGPFNPQASIVNFYNSKSLMGGHQDDLEFTFDKPVISLSMGLPAIFLLGGNTKDETPTPILVRSGDVMIMSGDSRLRFHGMCKILTNEGSDFTLPEVDEGLVCSEDEQITHFEVGGDFVEPEEEEKEKVEEFLKTHRINVNVRQVLPDGQDRIPDNEE